jgi:hypothetical protein
VRRVNEFACDRQLIPDDEFEPAQLAQFGELAVG